MVGTLAATITVPAGGGATIHLIYGTDPAHLDKATEDTAISGDNAAFRLTGLQPGTTYSYQIIRTNSAGQSVTSPIAQFTTSRFTVALHFVNNNSKPVGGVAAAIKDSDTSGTSDKDGLVNFKDIAPGDYSIDYKYRNQTHVLPISVDASSISDDDAAKTSVATLEYFINVEKASITTAPKPTGGKLWIWIVIILITVGGIIAFLIIRHRRAKSPYEDIVENTYQFNTSDSPTETPDPAVPLAPAEAPPIFPALDPLESSTAPTEPEPAQSKKDILASARRGKHSTVVEEKPPEHMGQSLKQMVMYSMKDNPGGGEPLDIFEEAKQREQQAKNQPKPQSQPIDPRNPHAPSHHYPWK